MLKVCPQVSPQVVAFSGKENNDVNVKRETHAGLKVGLVAGATHLALGIYKSGSVLKNAGIANWLYFLSKVGLTVGCGALVDVMINNKFKKGEDNNSTGKKFGPLFGAGAGAVVSFIASGKKVFSKVGLMASAVVSLGFAAGGLVLGAITDHFANKQNNKKAKTTVENSQGKQ